MDKTMRGRRASVKNIGNSFLGVEISVNSLHIFMTPNNTVIRHLPSYNYEVFGIFRAFFGLEKITPFCHNGHGAVASIVEIYYCFCFIIYEVWTALMKKIHGLMLINLQTVQHPPPQKKKMCESCCVSYKSVLWIGMENK
jgi:hypothetical protein